MEALTEGFAGRCETSPFAVTVGCRRSCGRRYVDVDVRHWRAAWHGTWLPKDDLVRG